MEIVSLHPVDDEVVRRYTATVQARLAAHTMPASVRSANQITVGLVEELSRLGPSFASQPFGLSFWEAQVDRSLGMLMRPPSRLFVDAGLDRRLAQAMPIRLEAQAGMMGGAWIPARLVPEALEGLDDHLERSAKRLVEAELEPALALELMWTALSHARDHGVGLIEAQDVIVPGLQGSHLSVVGPDLRRLPPDMLSRITTAITPVKKPGLLDRLFRRVEAEPKPPTNGHFSDVTTVEHHDS
jgi:hypothetical protein